MSADRSTSCIQGPVIAVAAALLSSVVSAAAPPDANAPATDSYRLAAVVRDFRPVNMARGHADFGREPDRGFGRYAGIVAMTLGADGKPMYVGGGFKVLSDWKDAQLRPIAPHLYNRRFRTGEIRGQSTVMLEDDDFNDAFEIRLVSVVFNDDNTSAWTYRVRELEGATDLEFWLLELDESHRVKSDTTPGYEVGIEPVSGTYGIRWRLPASFRSGTFTVVLNRHYLGEYEWGEVVAGSGDDTDSNDALLTPTDEIADRGSPIDPLDHLESTALGDVTGRRGPKSHGGIQSLRSFRQWFRDVPGVNLSAPVTLSFRRRPDGMHVFDPSTDPTLDDLGGFFPIEDRLFGRPDPDAAHNHHFTLELHARFTYDSSTAPVFGCRTDDDLWIFIGGKLALDLGGLHEPRSQWIDLSRLGLRDGQRYRLDLFFADRSVPQSTLRIETNLELESVEPSTFMPAFD